MKTMELTEAKIVEAPVKDENTYDPDKFIDVSTNHETRREDTYDPDKFIDESSGHEILSEDTYDPDKFIDVPTKRDTQSENTHDSDKRTEYPQNRNTDRDTMADMLNETSKIDDNGKQYRTENGEWIPNNTYVVDEIIYKTDDNSNIYSIDGKRQPNTTYELNGNIYKTDENGRIIRCEAKPIRSPENPRDNEAQRQAGGEDRRPNDQGGHIVGRDMNGDGGIGNLAAMDSRINQSDYKRMENDIKAALNEGKEVTTNTEITYNGDSERPDKFTVIVTSDGKDTVYKFDNNLDGSLRDEVPENGKETVQDRLEETSGEISSIKEEHDEEGSIVETTVYITYTSEEGTNYRNSVVIENQ